MNNSIKLPLSAKISFAFIILFSVTYFLYVAQEILIPIVMATIFAILLNPIVNFLESKKINKFSYYQDFLYAATDFSIVKIDVTKKEIKDMQH